MENATKALEMAGSLLIGVLLLGCLLFAYTRMSELKDTEHKVEVSEQAKDFNQDYETYNSMEKQFRIGQIMAPVQG